MWTIRKVLTVVLLSFLPALAGAQEVPGLSTPAAQSSLSQSMFLDVADHGNNVSTTTNWETAWGYYSKDQGRVRNLELTMRNPAKIPGEYQVEWYFFAVPMKGGKRFIYDLGSKKVSLAAGGLQKANVLSAELESHKSSYYYYYSDVKTGARPEGWAILVKIGDKILQSKASNAQVEQILKTPDIFEAMVSRCKEKTQH